MTTTQSAVEKSTAVDQRVERALTQFFAVEEAGPGLFLVHSASGSTYAADLREKRCTCPDHDQREGWF